MSKDLNKRLYYFSMFDGCLIKPAGDTNASLIVNMLAKNSDYIDKVKETLEEGNIGYLESLPEIYTKDGYDRQQQIRLHSHRHPIFTKIRKRIYLEGHKVIDPHMLTLMDEEALAIMFMADGSRCVDKRWENAKATYRLHTNNLCYGDQVLIKQCLKYTFGLEINIHKKGMKYDLAVPTAYSEFFEEIVSNFVLPSFQYKLGR
jgi:hypothetical protein